MDNSKRLYWIDCAKFIAILAVIVGHHNLSDELKIYIMSFHMPIFFFLNGYMYKKKEFTKQLKADIKSLIVPYLLITLLSCLFAGYLRNFVFNGWLDLNINTYSVNDILGLTIYGGWSVLWFLPCLFLSRIFLCIKCKFEQGNEYISLFLILCFSLIAVRIQFWISWSYMGFLYAYIGYFIRIKIHKNADSKNKISIVFLIVSGLIWIICCSVLDISINMKGSLYPMYPLSLIATLCGIYIVIFISKRIKKNKIISFLGGNTLMIYCIHSVEHNFIPWKLTSVSRLPIVALLGFVIFVPF